MSAPDPAIENERTAPPDPESTPARRRSPHHRRATIAALGLGVTAVAGGGLALQRAGDDSAPSTARAVSAVLELEPAARKGSVQLRGADLNGQSVDLATYRGQVVVINVWGSWCAPCRTEAPVLAAAANDYATAGVRFLGINVRDSVGAAKAFERRFGITYPSVVDTGAALLAFAGTIPPSGVPSTLILDRQGRVAARAIGQVRASTLRALIDRVLDDPGVGG